MRCPAPPRGGSLFATDFPLGEKWHMMIYDDVGLSLRSVLAILRSWLASAVCNSELRQHASASA